MSRIIGYGVSTRNVNESEFNVSQTVAMQELAFLGFDCSNKVESYEIKRNVYYLSHVSDIEVAVEMVRANDGRKPLLEAIIKEFKPGDTIVLYSMNTLFKGQGGKEDREDYYTGHYYYSEIVNKGINLLAFDFSGGMPRFSEFSIVFEMPDRAPYFLWDVFKRVRDEYRFPGYLLDELQKKKNSFLITTGKKIRENYVVETADGTEEENRRARAFQAIYFAYESYMISGGKEGMTLSLLKEYCGITTMLTFWRMAADFEKSIYYADLLNQFCEKFGFDIFEYPKRCGKLPQALEKLAADIRMTQSNFPDGSYSRDMVDNYIWKNGLLIDTDIYHRWHLTTIGAKKPRKPPVDFDLQKFRQVYKF